jgi:hypothetical protein
MSGRRALERPSQWERQIFRVGTKTFAFACLLKHTKTCKIVHKSIYAQKGNENKPKKYSTDKITVETRKLSYSILNCCI